MIVYIDVLFVINFILNYCILCISAWIRKKVQRFYLVAAALFGALYSVCMFYPNLSVLYHMVFRLMFSVILVFIAFRPKKPKELLQVMLTFYIITFLFGGIVFALFMMFGGRLGGVIRNGVLYFDISFTTLLLLTVVSYIAIRIGMGYIVKRISREKVLLPILVEIAEKRVVINGLVDTGSTLRDPLNRRPVIVVESQSVKDILPEGFSDIVRQPNTEAFNTLTEEKIKVSLIPFHVLDGGGVLLGIQPDRIEINGKESAAVLAISENALSDDNSYAAIINPEAIDSLGGEET